MSAPYMIFASSAPGLEPFVAREIAALGALSPEIVPGGVSARGHRRVIHRVALESGLAAHLLVRIGAFTADRWDVLERELAKLPWEDFLLPGVARDVKATAQKSRLHHTGGLAERAERAIAARLGEAPESGDPVPVRIRIVHDRAVVSIDAGGAPLHRRGYRIATSQAPLREDLARALLIAAEWDPATPLIDPFTGSGTIAIEAAALARALPPGRGRAGFALAHTALFHEPTWDAVREAAFARSSPRAPAPILASDRDPRMIERAKENAERAGVATDLTLTTASLSELDLSALAGCDRGLVVANPPYGQRLGERDELAPLHRALRRRVNELGPGFRVALITSERRLGMLVSDRLRTAFVTKSGGLTVRALVSP